MKPEETSVMTASRLTDERILTKIYLIRGLRVMLDLDLAALYNVQTKTLNRAVRRNLKRFPEDFYVST